MDLIKKGIEVKRNPKKFHNRLYERSLMTFFQAPSLRTEVSFDVAMFEMGGEIVDYHTETSPWAKGKESIEDVSRVISRYCDGIMIRMYSHKDLLKFARCSSIPVINGLTTVEHPCQIVGDFMTIVEEKGKLKGLKLVYVGDANNNVTHSLLLGCGLIGVNMSVCCPKKKEFLPDSKILKKARQLARKSKVKIEVTDDVEKGVKDADIVYTDSWMSYAIPKSQHVRRKKVLKKYQVNSKLMGMAKRDAIFMHCLPAKRGEEVTKGVIDGEQSVVFDEAENRLHIQKAILLKLIK